MNAMDMEPGRSMRPGAIAAGLILLGLGGAMLLDTSGLAHLHTSRLVAPLILIAMGTAIVLDRGGIIGRADVSGNDERPRMRRRGRRGPFGGVWLIGIGAWMLISQSHLFGLTYNTSWPLIVILAGLLMMFRGWR